MSRPMRIVARIGIVAAGLLAMAVVAAIITVQTDWFRNYVRTKLIATVEDETGGRLDMKTFAFDWRQLQVEMTGIVLHGTESAADPPLFAAPRMVLRLGLFSGWSNIVRLRYLAVDQPSVDVIVFPNGQTNIPTPRAVRKPGNKSSLETVVDLAIGDFEIRAGTVQFLQRKIAFSAHGRDLRAQLNYDPAIPRYRGRISMAPLLLASGSRPPLNLNVAIPLDLEKDKIQITKGRIETPKSHIDIDASLEHFSAPRVAGQLNAHIALAEIARSIDLGMQPRPNRGPQSLDAAVEIRGSQENIEVSRATMSLGRTHLEVIEKPGTGIAEISGDVSLDELGQLFQVASQPRGDLRVAGTVRTGGSAVEIDGSLGSPEISMNHGQWRAKDLLLNTTVKVSPNLIEVSGLSFKALGGELRAEARVEELTRFTAAGDLRGFDIQSVASSLGHAGLQYSGAVSGKLSARGDLRSPGRSGINGDLAISIALRKTGMPVSGTIRAVYSGAHDLISLRGTHINLPNTQITASGDLGASAEVHIASRNLNDFLPAVWLTSPSRKKLPIALRGGTADLLIDEHGPLQAPQFTGRVAVTNFAVEDRPFDRLTADLAASPSSATVRNGSLTRKTLRASFSASVGLHDWAAGSNAPLQANANIQNGDLSDLLALAGESDIQASGALNANATINGTIGNPIGSMRLTAVKGAIDDQPYDLLQANVALSDQLVTLTSAQLTSPAGSIALQGSYRHPRDAFTTGHAQLHLASSQIQLEQIRPLVKHRPGVSGVASLNADVAGDLRRDGDSSAFVLSLLNADIHARGVRDSQQIFGNLTATARTNGSTVRTRIDSDFAGSTFQLTGQTQLTRDYPTTADATIQNLPIERVVALTAPQAIRASGTLSAKAHATGTLDDAHVNLSFALAKALIEDEPIDSVTGTVDYTNQTVNLSALRIVSPAGTADLKATMSHNRFAFGSGHVDVHLATDGIDLHRVHYIQANKPGIAGALRVVADGSVDLRDQNGKQQVLLSRLDANGGVSGIAWQRKQLGGIAFQSETRGTVLSLKLDSDVGGSAIHGTGQMRLQGDYPVDAKVTFGNVTYSGLQGLVGTPDDIRPDFDALLEGVATVSGPAMAPAKMRGDLQVSRLELLTSRHHGSPGNAKETILQNQGPITAHMENSAIEVRSAHLTGRSSDITVKGNIALSRQSSFNLKINANANLDIIKDLYRDAYAGGVIAVDATVRGTLSEPRVNGKVELKDASLNLAGFTEGISHTNGVISLNGASATLQNVTAESGGGKITLTGSTGFIGNSLRFDIRANATQVRARYAGASIVSNASIALSGSTERSLLSGRVTIVKVGYNPQSDVGSMLTQAGTPTEAPSDEKGPLDSMRLAIRVQTAPDVRFETSMAQGLDGQADLNVRGTLASPGIVGRVSITAGTLVFFGNPYTVNRGVISFYNPLKVQPVLDVDLETTAKSVNVILSLTGPIDDLKLSYHSDPPLKFEDIVGLLATGRTPRDATIAAHQPAQPDQSTMQMGESAVVGQALANPVANRLQRVFGVSQLKIDPSFSNGSSLPQARVSLQQQVSPTITFTYTTDVTQTNSQIIRVEWAVSPRFSAVATRDENGVFGVDFFYKRKFR